ncbi:N-acetyltransferase [Bacillus sp. Marseille-P3661]|uniref:N-acetyltransferase n=1 Tax=Bacillus sp. Marseille-P3661 TaxID=1936234 RepID=UPI000C863FB8|nr:N-acetyltransferase [Bacillus sp. Marseille-P3661]
METIQVEKLLVNYKTLEDFKSFKQYGNQELQMLEDLQANIVENDYESPFYGIYYGDKLVARMSLYQTSKKFDRIFNGQRDYLDLSKLEVLPQHQAKGYGRRLIEFAKSFDLPIITRPRVNSDAFWSKMGFESLDSTGSESEKLLVWYPEQYSENKLN